MTEIHMEALESPATTGGTRTASPDTAVLRRKLSQLETRRQNLETELLHVKEEEREVRRMLLLLGSSAGPAEGTPEYDDFQTPNSVLSAFSPDLSGSPAANNETRRTPATGAASDANAPAEQQPGSAPKYVLTVVGGQLRVKDTETLSVQSVLDAAKMQEGCKFLQKVVEAKEKEEQSGKGIVASVIEAGTASQSVQDGAPSAELWDSSCESIDVVAVIQQTCFADSVDLACDPFGNYLLQRLLPTTEPDFRVSVIKLFGNELHEVAQNMHGTRCLQKLIIVSTTEKEIEALTTCLKPHVLLLCKDLNGNHVLQQVLTQWSDPSDRQFIYDALRGRCTEVCVNRQGCCVVQRCFSAGSESQKSALVSEILDSVLFLVNDSFGNYVVQYLLDYGDDDIIKRIVQKMLHNIATLACDKFSSNVVEKCFKVANDDVRQLIVDEITDPHVLPMLLKDGFANYVIQTALKLANDDLYMQLVQAIRPLLGVLKNCHHRKRIEQRMSRPRKNGQKNRRGRKRDQSSDQHPASSLQKSDTGSMKQNGIANESSLGESTVENADGNYYLPQVVAGGVYLDPVTGHPHPVQIDYSALYPHQNHQMGFSSTGVPEEAAVPVTNNAAERPWTRYMRK